mmetsp:Transcript_53889/g.64846  ORF Transcript_53889/g.64846 Transcript_53889/m.64846 type:complete len:109 (-) Transcript_53889:185-511(-)
MQLRETAYADHIFLNKIDLLNPSQPHSSLLTLTRKPNSSTTMENVQALISGKNPTALCVTTQYSRIPNLNQILDAHCFDMERVRDVERTSTQTAAQHKELDACIVLSP